MKRSARILLWSLLVIGLAGAGVATVLSLRAGNSQAEAVQYHCPMHPTYISEKPGDCPICGMRLVPIEPAQAGAPTTADSVAAAPAVPAVNQSAPADSLAYVCPMHPEVHAATPSRCPTCGMALEAAKAGQPAPASAGYVCPMHPEITSDRPASCSKCGMDLEKVVAPAKQGATTSQGRPLYYRNPMNPAVRSPVPVKDEMGMDYVPVYADEAATALPVSGLAVVRADAEGLRQAGVQVAAARRGELGRRIRTVGIIAADETRVRQVSVKSDGWIESLQVATSGQVVRKGDPLLTLYSPELLAAQEEYLQALAAARDFGDGAAGSGAAALLEAARRRLQLLDLPSSVIQDLEHGGAQRTVTLRSPASGYVTAKDVVAGQRIEAGEALFTVTDLSRVWVEAAFAESEAALVRVGQLLALEQPDQPGGRLVGRVSQILPALDPDSRTLRVRAGLDNPALALKPGMYVDVVTEVSPRAGLLIPDSAVLDTGLRQVVYVETDAGTFSPREIRTGQRGGGQALVLSGLREGERVATAGNFLLDSEARIRGAIAGMAN